MALFGRRVKDDCVDVTVVLQEILNLVIADTKVKQASLGIQRCFLVHLRQSKNSNNMTSHFFILVISYRRVLVGQFQSCCHARKGKRVLDT